MKHLNSIQPDFELQNSAKDSVVTVEVSGPFIAKDEQPAGIHYLIICYSYMLKSTIIISTNSM